MRSLFFIGLIILSGSALSAGLDQSRNGSVSRLGDFKLDLENENTLRESLRLAASVLGCDDGHGAGGFYIDVTDVHRFDENTILFRWQLSVWPKTRQTSLIQHEQDGKVIDVNCDFSWDD